MRQGGPSLHNLLMTGMAALLLTALAACSSPAPGLPTPDFSPSPDRTTPAQTATLPPTATNAPSGTATATTAAVTASPTASATPWPAALCAPLEGVPLSDMGKPDLLKNPFDLPKPGSDDGHHGADFAYWSRGDRKEMLGLPVYSALSGRVAGVIKNRPPYGNAVIIETQLDALPVGWLATIPVPTPAPTVAPAANLICPKDPRTYDPQAGRSLYLLYAHLNKTPALTIGQSIACGAPIGEVGTTGNSVNPHLHLETRAGPSGATFPAMAHYINNATEDEMRNYCTWRVSGLFQMFDPLRLLSLQQ